MVYHRPESGIAAAGIGLYARKCRPTSESNAHAFADTHIAANDYANASTDIHAGYADLDPQSHRNARSWNNGYAYANFHTFANGSTPECVNKKGVCQRQTPMDSVAFNSYLAGENFNV